MGNVSSIYEDIASKLKKSTGTTDFLDPYRYINWFNQERGQLFFARGILFVEGLTEKGLFEFLSDKEDGEWSFLQKNHIYILDCCGKHEIIRWAEIAKELNIPFGIIFDLDGNESNHKVWNEKIKELYPEQLVYTFEKYLEDYLGVEKPERSEKLGNSHEHNLLLYVDEKIDLVVLDDKNTKNDIEKNKNNVRMKLSELSKKIKKYFEKLI